VVRSYNPMALARLLSKLLKKPMRPPRVMVTDKLASYGAAKREIMPGIEHRQHEGLNNRAANSHQPTCRIYWPGAAVASAHDQINNPFYLRRDHLTAPEHRAARMRTFRVWAEISSIAATSPVVLLCPSAHPMSGDLPFVGLDPKTSVAVYLLSSGTSIGRLGNRSLSYVRIGLIRRA
jgi:hypothetical protein